MSHVHAFTDLDGVRRTTDRASDCDIPSCPWRTVETWEKRTDLPDISFDTFAKTKHTEYANGVKSTYVTLCRFKDKPGSPGDKEMTSHILLFPESLPILRDLLDSLDLGDKGKDKPKVTVHADCYNAGGNDRPEEICPICWRNLANPDVEVELWVPSHTD